MPNWLSNNVLKIYDAYLKKYNIMDKYDPLSGYNKIPLGQNRTNGAVYSALHFFLRR